MAPHQPHLTLADVANLASRDVAPSEHDVIGGHTPCTVCMSAARSHLAMPCGHLGVCALCSDRTSCPCCGERVHYWMKPV